MTYSFSLVDSLQLLILLVQLYMFLKGTFQHSCMLFTWFEGVWSLRPSQLNFLFPILFLVKVGRSVREKKKNVKEKERKENTELS